ncbi:MAG: Lrp/AsnC family transcriptional regulator [Thermoplasmata archaeon]|nr:MAG: Lrp/AsnC family transcriptional regulator [Thermoplasmata archaeon]
MQKDRYLPDELDKRIMSQLQRDCNTSIRQLSARLDIPTSTVQRRIANLHGKGIIKGYQAMLDRESLGYSTIFSLVKVATGFIKDDGGYVKKFAEEEIRGQYEVEPKQFFIMDRASKLMANPWEFVLNVFSSLKPRSYGEDIAAVQVVYALYGRFDVLMKVVGTDQKILGRYLEDKVSIIPGITNIETFTVFDVLKDDKRLPFAEEVEE